LQVSTGHNCCGIDLMDVPICAAAVGTVAVNSPTALAPQSCPTPSLAITWSNDEIRPCNNLDPFTLPSQVTLSITQYFQLTAILKSPYSSTLFLKHNEFLIPLTSE
jgi:hypothetical protein